MGPRKLTARVVEYVCDNAVYDGGLADSLWPRLLKGERVHVLSQADRIVDGLWLDAGQVTKFYDRWIAVVYAAAVGEYCHLKGIISDYEYDLTSGWWNRFCEESKVNVTPGLFDLTSMAETR